jgi:hypothetical protein
MHASQAVIPARPSAEQPAVRGSPRQAARSGYRTAHGATVPAAAWLALAGARDAPRTAPLVCHASAGAFDAGEQFDPPRTAAAAVGMVQSVTALGPAGACDPPGSVA